MKYLGKSVLSYSILSIFPLSVMAVDPTPIEGVSLDGYYISIYFDGPSPPEIAIWQEGDSIDTKERYKVRINTMKNYNNEECVMFDAGIDDPKYFTSFSCQEGGKTTLSGTRYDGWSYDGALSCNEGAPEYVYKCVSGCSSHVPKLMTQPHWEC